MKKRLVFLAVLALSVALSTTGLMAQISATIALTGTVLDEASRKPVTVTLTILDENGKKVNTTRSNEKEGGLYYVILKPGTRYKVQFDNPNYFRQEFNVETPNSTKYAEVTRDWLVRPLALSAKIHLPVSPFEYKKSKMRMGAETMLAEIRNMMVMNPNVHFDVVCYPDLNDSKEANNRLTTDRATALRDYFIKGGVSADRIVIRASSEVDPLNPIPLRKGAKGRRYVGSTYLLISKV